MRRLPVAVDSVRLSRQLLVWPLLIASFLTFMASSAGWRPGLRSLYFLPLFNRRTIETPIASDAKTGKPALTEKPVNSGRMNA